MQREVDGGQGKVERAVSAMSSSWVSHELSDSQPEVPLESAPARRDPTSWHAARKDRRTRVKRNRTEVFVDSRGSDLSSKKSLDRIGETVKAPWKPQPTVRRIGLSASATELFVSAYSTQVEEDRAHWSFVRRACAYILECKIPCTESHWSDLVMGLIIMFNIVVMVAESDAMADCDVSVQTPCTPTWIQVANVTTLLIYIIEVALRIVAYRLQFWTSGWNLLDVSIVLVGIVSQTLNDLIGSEASKVNVLRLVRIVRIFRVAKILKHFPTLRSMLWGFAGAMYAMAWGLVLILFLIVFWSMLAVEFAHPVNKRLSGGTDYCEKAFSSTWKATILFFQTLVAGDSWGACVIPIVNEDPTTFILFALALVTIQLGFTNLVLAVIVDKATEAREGSKEEQRQDKLKAELSNMEKWREAMAALDADQSGTITMEEFLSGFNLPIVQETMAGINVKLADIASLFYLMDEDDSGELSYDEFVDNFFTAQTQDPRIYSMSMKLHIQKLGAQMEQLFEEAVNRLESVISEPASRSGDRARSQKLSDSSPPSSRPCSPVHRSPPSSLKPPVGITAMHLPPAGPLTVHLPSSSNDVPDNDIAAFPEHQQPILSEDTIATIERMQQDVATGIHKELQDLHAHWNGITLITDETEGTCQANALSSLVTWEVPDEPADCAASGSFAATGEEYSTTPAADGGPGFGEPSPSSWSQRGQAQARSFAELWPGPSSWSAGAS